MEKIDEAQVTGVTIDVIFDRKYIRGGYKFIIGHFNVDIRSNSTTPRRVALARMFKEAGLRSPRTLCCVTQLTKVQIEISVGGRRTEARGSQGQVYQFMHLQTQLVIEELQLTQTRRMSQIMTDKEINSQSHSSNLAFETSFWVYREIDLWKIILTWIMKMLSQFLSL